MVIKRSVLILITVPDTVNKEKRIIFIWDFNRLKAWQEKEVRSFYRSVPDL
jgi:hypothetical protein